MVSRSPEVKARISKTKRENAATAREQDAKDRESRRQVAFEAVKGPAGAVAAKYAPHVALGIGGAVVLDTPDRLSHMLVLPLRPLGVFRVEGPGFNIGFDIEFMRQGLAESIAYMFHGDGAALNQKFSFGDRVVIASLITMTTILAQDLILGFARTLHDVIVEAVPT
jgi:hypothetical protein